ncbi:hypothetical protein Tco_0275677, partial [Tanacetum coccineum]
TRHIYANFKKKWSGLQYKRLFWKAAASSMNPAEQTHVIASASSAPVDEQPETSQDPKKANKRKKKADSEQPLPFRIYHKNRGRSERIAKLQAKKFKFDANGTRSTPEKAFDVSD